MKIIQIMGYKRSLISFITNFVLSVLLQEHRKKESNSLKALGRGLSYNQQILRKKEFSYVQQGRKRNLDDNNRISNQEVLSTYCLMPFFMMSTRLKGFLAFYVDQLPYKSPIHATLLSLEPNIRIAKQFFLNLQICKHY